MQSLLWRGLYFITVLLLNIFLSRYLQAANTGFVYYLSNIFSFTLIIFSVSLESGITYFASGKIIDPKKLIWFTVAWSFAVAILALAAVYIYLFFTPGIPAISDSQFYFFSTCYIAGLFLTNCGTALFYAKNNFILPNFLLIFWNIVLIIIIPKFGVAKDLSQAGNILQLYFLIFLLQGLSVCIAWLVKEKNITAVSLPTAIEIKKIFKYSAVVVTGNIIFFLVYRIDYLFVNASPVCTAADLGNYIQVSKLGQMLLIIPQIIASVIFPRSASGINRKELNSSLMTIARLFSQLYLLIIIITVVGGTWLFTGMFGETFNKMQWPFIILMPGIFSLSVLAMLSAYFSGKGNLRVNLTGAALALLVVIIGDYFFVPLYGILAAAAISTLGYTVNLGYSLYIFYKDYDINFFDFFRWRKSDYRWLRSLTIKKNN